MLTKFNTTKKAHAISMLQVFPRLSRAEFVSPQAWSTREMPTSPITLISTGIFAQDHEVFGLPLLTQSLQEKK